MRKITENELQEILRKHGLWLNGNEEGERADLSGADLREADLTGAYLTGADLTGAYLTGADLTGAYLTGADLRRAYLRGADLTGAYLTGADLRRAYLTEADLYGANLREADLRRAYLRGAYLTGADLTGAYLTGDYLTGADLRGAKGIPYIPLACPEEGSFIGFKKAILDGNCIKPVIIKLLILEDAKRSSGTGRKCRCSKAKVLDIQDLEGGSIGVIACSTRDYSFKYKIGEVVEVKDFDDNRFNECAPGIHFFINRQDAVDY